LPSKIVLDTCRIFNNAMPKIAPRSRAGFRIETVFESILEDGPLPTAGGQYRQRIRHMPGAFGPSTKKKQSIMPILSRLGVTREIAGAVKTMVKASLPPRRRLKMLRRFSCDQI